MPKFFASCAAGSERAVEDELRAIGITSLDPGHSGVFFDATNEQVYEAHLTLRTASRIFRPLRSFSAVHQEMLYDQVRRIHWEEWFDNGKTFAVECDIAGENEELRHSAFVALKTKDAICDRFRQKTGDRPNVEKRSPQFKIHVYLRDTRATVSIDATGEPLNFRGYREEDTGAPLRETLAATLLHLMNWNPSLPLVDLMCGSGTLLIEAAWKGLNRAPNRDRVKFLFQNWPDFDLEVWNRVKERVKAAELQLSETESTVAETGAKTLRRRPAGAEMELWGFDIDRQAIRAARANAGRANVVRLLHLETQAIETFEFATALPRLGDRKGILFINPPYGDRLGDEEDLSTLYREIGRILKHEFPGWTAWVLSGNPRLTQYLGLQAKERIPIFNGSIECRLLRYDLYSGTAKDTPSVLGPVIQIPSVRSVRANSRGARGPVPRDGARTVTPTRRPRITPKSS